MQTKLTAEEIENCHTAIKALKYISKWGETPCGAYALNSVWTGLKEMAEHGTSNGKPWVEPPLTDEDALSRPWCVFWDGENEARSLRCTSILVHVDPHKDVEPKHLDRDGVFWRFARRATAEEIAAMEKNQ